MIKITWYKMIKNERWNKKKFYKMNDCVEESFYNYNVLYLKN